MYEKLFWRKLFWITFRILWSGDCVGQIWIKIQFTWQQHWQVVLKTNTKTFSSSTFRQITPGETNMIYYRVAQKLLNTWGTTLNIECQLTLPLPLYALILLNLCVEGIRTLFFTCSVFFHSKNLQEKYSCGVTRIVMRKMGNYPTPLWTAQVNIPSRNSV